MKERNFEVLIADVNILLALRRAFVQRMITVRLSAPIARMMLSQVRGRDGCDSAPYKPIKAVAAAC